MQRVAQQLGKNTLTADDYRRHGTFSPDLARGRCGSWFNALAQAGLRKSRNLNIDKAECLADLKRVGRELGKRSVTQQDYKEHGKFSPAPLIRHFGSWFAALDTAGLERTRTLNVTKEEYFENLEQMWMHLGRQPRYSEVQKPFSRYSSGAYEARFGSWRKALEAFVTFVNQEPPEEDNPQTETRISQEMQQEKDETSSASTSQRSRHISWRLRFLVMRRDDFKCQCCGNSPALAPGLVLHVDHIKPWSKDGHTKMDNLQTLCDRCNIGKSDLPMNKQTRG